MTITVIVPGDRGPIPRKDLLIQNINLFAVTGHQCQEMRQAEEVAKGLEEDLEVTDGWFCQLERSEILWVGTHVNVT